MRAESYLPLHIQLSLRVDFIAVLYHRLGSNPSVVNAQSIRHFIAVKASRILFVAPPLFGHINQLVVLAEELAERGHRVTFACADQFKNRIGRGRVEFMAWRPETAITDAALLERRDKVWELASKDANILRGEQMMLGVVADSYPAMYETLAPIYRQCQPELVIADSAVVPAFDLADQLGIAYIVQAQFLGNHVKIPPAYPRYGSAFTIRMTPWERVINFFVPLTTTARFLPGIIRLNQMRRRCGARTTLRKLLYSRLMLVGTAFGVEIPRALPPLVQLVGPMMPRTVEPLSLRLRAWLEEDSRQPGVVFMSFGTLATLETWQAKALLEGVVQAGFRLLWSLRKTQQTLLPALPPSVRVEPFVPQQTVLAHPAVRGFVSHCGMNSLSESLYWAKPILGLPIFGDQHFNAARVEDLGVGLRLNKQRFNDEEVRAKLTTIVQDPKYRAAAARMSCVLRNSAGLERAVALVETGLEAGFEHLVAETAYRFIPGARPGPD